MSDLELYEHKQRLEFLYNRTKKKRIKWKLNNKIILVDIELRIRECI